MLIKSILRSEEFKALGDQYISFVQVGGAYAHRYFAIVNYLGIKTIILTDLDYNSPAKDEEEVLSSTITNSAIKFFYKECHPQIVSTEELKVQEIYDWKATSSPLVFGDKGKVYLGFQGENEKFSRTLEEAMLSKFYAVSSIEEISREEWKEKRNNDKLKYSIPNEEKSALRNIVLSTSNGKTDFMYSVIMEKLQMEMLPDYISEALECPYGIIKANG